MECPLKTQQTLARRGFAQPRLAGREHDQFHAVEVLRGNLFGRDHALIVGKAAGIDPARAIGPGQGQAGKQSGVHGRRLRFPKSFAETLRSALGQEGWRRQFLLDEEAMRGQVQVTMLAGPGEHRRLGGPVILQGQDALLAEVLAIELFDRRHFVARPLQRLEVHGKGRQTASGAGPSAWATSAGPDWAS